MEYHIWRQLIQILSYRKDLIVTIKPFFTQLNNNIKNEKYNINEEKYIPFLKSFPKKDIEILHKNEIMNKDIYAALAPKSEYKPKKSSKSLNSEEKIIKEIIKGDKLEEMQKLIREKGISAIGHITKSFDDGKTKKTSIIVDCIIHKAIRCFKYLLINGIEEPVKPFQDQNTDSDSKYWKSLHNYYRECMTKAIFYGEVEIMKILEEKGIEKGDNPEYIEAAILSYRNGIAKEIINQMKEKDEKINDEILMKGLIASTKCNNIKGAELLINNGAKFTEKDIIYQNRQILFLIKKFFDEEIQFKQKNKTPLHYAAENNANEVGKLLITKGADINAKDIIYQSVIFLF